MNPVFWSNTVWYLLIGVSILIEIALILIKAKNRWQALAFYFTVSGLVFFYEMIILSYLMAYTYHPMIIPGSPPDDAIVGNLFSQFSVAATAVLIAVYELRYYWYLIFAAAYGIIEELFLKLGIYEHYWYQTWLTVVGLLLLFWIARRMYTSLKDMGLAWRYIYIFFGTLALYIHTVTWTSRLSGIRMFSENFLPVQERSLVVLSGGYFLLLSITMMAVYFWKTKWWWKAALVVALYAANYIAALLHLIYVREGWFIITTTISIFGMYVFIYIFDRLYGQVGKTNDEY